ncbi:C-GCAxxG-C-C family protein [Endozoicomonas lisbonensis]|uniref:C_GCAxxG_C_C family probable redox protein n=1 Tax=Endozoicomonas lisbonensis TaxID=3120522 RepID=A0ABV2SJC6_9GAMM
MPLPKKHKPASSLSKREQAIEDRRLERMRQYDDISETARKKAETLYRKRQFLCSEAVFTTVNDHLGQPADPRMVKMASGFPVGIGMSGCLCGAVAGGVMALGLEHGREQKGEKLSDDIFPLSSELHDRFQKRNGSTCCRKLIKHVEFGSREHIRQCIRLTGEVAADVVDLIEHGITEPADKALSDCSDCPSDVQKTSRHQKPSAFSSLATRLKNKLLP